MDVNGSINSPQEPQINETTIGDAQPTIEPLSSTSDGQPVADQSPAISANPNGIVPGVELGKSKDSAGSQNAAEPLSGTLTAHEPSSTAPASFLREDNLANPTVDDSTDPVLTPFLHPHPSAQLPTRPALTPEQEAKYSALLKSARSWTTVPSSNKSQEALAITPSEKLWLTRECLLRYLRASKWVVSTAATRLQATLTWRREYGLASHTADYISEENETGKQVVLGYDTAGRPCLYLNPHKQNTKESKRQMHHLVFMLERSIDLMAPGVETLALLVNFKDSRRGQSASITQGRETIGILQNHYPERLGRALVQDVPWLIWGFFKAISPFIDPLTREKLKFDEDLRLLVPPEQLVKHFKGDVEFEYVHEKYWKALNELAEGRKKDMWERWEQAGSLVGESESYLKGVGESERARESAAPVLE